MRAKPDNMPEDAAFVQEYPFTLDYKQQFKLLLKNRNFLYIALSTGLQISYFCAFTTVLVDMVIPFEFVSNENL